jgi:hypothetical protein
VISFVRLLPAVFAAVLTYVAVRRRVTSRATALLLAFVLVEIVAVVQIEVLSRFVAHRAGPAVAWWTVVAALALVAARRAERAAPAERFRDPWERGLVAATGALLGGTLATALLGAPNTWDALSYHLPRASQWVQNASIAHFPTSIPRQLKMPPLAEILVSQTMLLAGSDRLVNLVQWFAYGASGVATFALVRGAGRSRLAGLGAALLFLSSPMAVLQASGPKNDLVLCANLGAASVFLCRGLPALAWGWLVAGAAALGLAVLTKGTALVFAPVVVALAVGGAVRRHGWRRGARVAAVVALVIAALNAGHWARNLTWFGTPLGPGGEGQGYEYANRRFGVDVLASNLLRNVAIHLETPRPVWNRTIESAVEAAHRWMGVALDDPATTWPEARLAVLRFPSRNEDQTGNPLQLLLIVAALAAVPLASRRDAEAGTTTRFVALALVAAALLFCAALRWQVWHSRLHLPLFLGGGVLVALVAARRSRALAATALLAALLSAPALLGNRARPLLGERSVVRQTRWEGLLGGHRRGGDRLAARLAELDLREIGLRLGGDDPEYLIWAVARSANPRARLRHVDVSEGTLSRAEVPLDALVTYGGPPTTESLLIEGRQFRVDRRCDRFTLWRPVR